MSFPFNLKWNLEETCSQLYISISQELHWANVCKHDASRTGTDSFNVQEISKRSNRRYSLSSIPWWPMFPLNAITFGRSLSRYPGALSRFVAMEHSHTRVIYDPWGLRQSAESRFAVRSCVPLARSCRRVNKQNCMRTAYVGAARTRIPCVRRLSEHRIRKLSLSFTLRPRQILFAADNFFFTTLCFFVSHPPTSFRLFIICLVLPLCPCSVLSVNNSRISSTSPLHIHQIPPPVALCVLAIRFKEIDSSSLYDVLSSRVNTKALVLVETRRISGPGDDFYVYCFSHVTFLVKSCSQGTRSTSWYLDAPHAASFGTKGLLG